MKLSRRQAAAKALAELQLIPEWWKLDEQLREIDPFGTNCEVLLHGITETLDHKAERPLEVMKVEMSEHGERNPYLVRALLFLLNDMGLPAAIWNRERDGKKFAELVVYEA